jgi:hypothetical protein
MSEESVKSIRIQITVLIEIALRVRCLFAFRQVKANAPF